MCWKEGFAGGKLHKMAAPEKGKGKVAGHEDTRHGFCALFHYAFVHWYHSFVHQGLVGFFGLVGGFFFPL